MEVKKHPKADLEKDKLTFSLVGLVLTLGLIYGAFEYTSATGSVEKLTGMENLVMEDDQVPITRQNQPPPPPPPPPPQAPAEMIDIVDDDEEIDDEMLIDTEVQEDEVIEIVEVEEEVEEEQQPFVIVEQMPEFPGGQTGLMKHIGKNVKYPNVARETGVQGRVFVRFVVTAKGGVEKVSIARGVDPLLDKEAIRVIKALPKWKAGRQRGKNVPVWYTVPINFQLQ